jgi:hypothetical protein
MPPAGCSNGIVEGSEFCPGTELQITFTQASSDLSVASFRGGSEVDVLVGHSPGGAHLYQGPSLQTLAIIREGGNVRAVAAPDLDVDGRPDVVLAVAPSEPTDPPADEIVLYHNGDGDPIQFAEYETHLVEAGVVDLITPDIDGNGVIDIVTLSEMTGNLSVLLGGGGTFGAPTAYPAATAPQSIAARDVDGDGDMDLVVAPLSGNEIGVLLQDAGAFAVAQPLVTGPLPSRVEFADVDGDEEPDLLVACEGSGEVWIFPWGVGGTVGALGPATVASIGRPPAALAAGDLDRNSIPDLVAATSDGFAVVLFGEEGGTFRPREIELSGTPNHIAVHDVSADSMADILVTKGGSRGGFSVVFGDP